MQDSDGTAVTPYKEILLIMMGSYRLLSLPTYLTTLSLHLTINHTSTFTNVP